MAAVTSPENETRYFKSKTQSIISVCNTGSGNELFNYPLGVTIDHSTGNIYVLIKIITVDDVFDNIPSYRLSYLL